VPLDHFALIAPYYDRIFGRGSLTGLLARLAPEPHHRVLDVGGGTGRVAARLADYVRQVCVLDPSPGMLVQGQRKGICITRGEAEDLPFANAAFERVIVVDAFHHLRDQEQAVRELLRVLAPGGFVVIEEPDIDHWGVKVVALAEKFLHMRSCFRTAGEMRRMLERARAYARVEREGYTVWVIAQK